MKLTRIDKIAEDVSDLKSGLSRVEVHISEIKDDIKYHIKRTDISENRLFRLEKVEQWLRGATWLAVGLAGLIIAVVKLFN